MLHINLIQTILTILAENGETRTLTLIKLINNYINRIKIEEPIVFEHVIGKNKHIPLPFNTIRTNWGDGRIDYIARHVYGAAGKYRIKIYNSTDKLEIIKYYRWPNNIINFISIGRTGVTDFEYMFCNNKYNFIIGPNWDTTKITHMGGMFFNAQKFNRKIGDNWDTSRVTNMRGMFYGAYNFNQKIGDNWDTSQVVDMSSMFYCACNFNQKIGDNWDTSQVTDMRYMFYRATDFNQKIGDNWNTSNIRNMDGMFYGATNFNQRIGDNWNVPNIISIHRMFNDDYRFGCYSIWNTILTKYIIPNNLYKKYLSDQKYK